MTPRILPTGQMWTRPAPAWCLPALLTLFCWATADTWRYLAWRLARWAVVALWRAEYLGR